MLDSQAFFSQFTTRQHEVLVCVLAGDTNRQIAARLELSESSVKRYVTQLIRMAGAHRRKQVQTRWLTFVQPEASGC